MLRPLILLLTVTLLLALGGCTPENGDYFAPLQGDFSARIKGEWQALAFEAELSASAPDGQGERVMTLTFYAPSSLSGTVLKKEASGALTLTSEDITLPLTAQAARGYGALFALFPTTGTVRDVTREGENTRLTGEGFSLLFAPDGTPLAAENDTASVRIERFEG